MGRLGTSMLPPWPAHVPELHVCTVEYVRLSVNRRPEDFHLADSKRMFSSSKAPNCSPLASATICTAATGQSPGGGGCLMNGSQTWGEKGSGSKEFPSWVNQEPSFSVDPKVLYTTEQNQGRLPEEGRGTSGVVECLSTVSTAIYTGDRNIVKLHGCYPFPDGDFGQVTHPSQPLRHPVKWVAMTSNEHEDAH